MESLQAARQDLAAHCDEVVESLVDSNRNEFGSEALGRIDANGNGRSPVIGTNATANGEFYMRIFVHFTIILPAYMSTILLNY